MTSSNHKVWAEVEALGYATSAAAVAALPAGIQAEARALDRDILAEVFLCFFSHGMIGPTANPESAYGQKPGTHDCLVFSERSEALKGAIEFFRQGSLAGQKCVWLLPKWLSPAEARRQLSSLDVDLYPVAGVIRGAKSPADAIRNFWARQVKAAVRTAPALRACGVVDWPAAEAEWAGFMEFERTFHSGVSAMPIVALCAYSAKAERPSDVLRDVLASHHHVHFKTKDAWRHVRAAPALSTFIERLVR